MNIDAAIATDSDAVLRARQMHSLIERASSVIEQGRQVTAEVQAALHGARLFQLYLPHRYGGEEVPPATFVAVVEELAKADASTAWCVAQASGCSLAAAYLDPDVARDIFGGPGAVLSWGPVGQKVRAVIVDGGYRVSGTWPYASGSRHARWLAGHCPIVDADGKPQMWPDGKPMERTLLFPKSSATVHDVWHVVGLKGTGSDSYTVDDVFVPASYSFTRESSDDRRESGPLYRFTTYQLFGVSFAGVALGIARAALDAFIAVAASKVPMLAAKPLRDSASVQLQVAQAEARLQASRALVFQTLDQMWKTAVSGKAFSLQQRAMLRLAAVHAVHQCREVVETAYHLAGGTAIFEDQAFERRMRDIHAVTQQVQSQISNFEVAGQVLLGLPVTSKLI